MSRQQSLLLPDQVYGEEHHAFSVSDEDDQDSVLYESYAQEMHRLLKSLEIWDDVDLLDNSQVIYDNWPDKCQRFLVHNNIRPDFFCQYDKILSQTKNNRQRLIKGRTNFSHDLQS